MRRVMALDVDSRLRMPLAVIAEPYVVLVAWELMQVQIGAVHFVGRRLDNGLWRVSSTAESFDAGQSVGVTRSGRRYTLRGNRGFDADGAITWMAWCKANGVTAPVRVQARRCNAICRRLQTFCPCEEVCVDVLGDRPC